MQVIKMKKKYLLKDYKIKKCLKYFNYDRFKVKFKTDQISVSANLHFSTTRPSLPDQALRKAHLLRIQAGRVHELRSRTR